jgi:hypothetical protein
MRIRESAKGGNMKNILLAAGALASLVATTETRAGTFYGLWWDGSAEQFVSVDPYTSGMTVIKQIPGVKYISPGALLDPDSSRYGFVGMESGQQQFYYALHAPTGDLVAKVAKTDTLTGLVYSPNDRKVYGLTWTDTSGVDSLGRPRHIPRAGKEYFVSLDPFTGTRVNTYLPAVVSYQANSTFLDSDSGRYVFTAQERTGGDFYYVVETATGNVLARVPVTHRIDNPVYNPALGAVHGLWWADSSYYPDSMAMGPDSILVPSGPKVVQGTEYFVTVRRDSTVTRVAIPGVKYIAAFINAFDSDSGRYVFVGGTGNAMSYFVIDVATGAVISQTLRTHNVHNLVYAPDHSTFDASYGSTRIAAPGVQARPAKVKTFAGHITLEAAGAEGESLSLSILDVSGKTLLRRDGIRNGRARIETRGLKNGIHLYQIRSGSLVLGQGKVLIR